MSIDLAQYESDLLVRFGKDNRKVIRIDQPIYGGILNKLILITLDDNSVITIEASLVVGKNGIVPTHEIKIKSLS